MGGRSPFHLSRTIRMRCASQARADLVCNIDADMLLFGSFLLWAVAARISMKSRIARTVPGAPESRANDFVIVVVGLAVYAVTVLWLHEMLFGVRPFV